MLITALFTLIASLVLFASGRLVLAFFPPGWPGFAPGMGTRELGATIGASWFLGALVQVVIATLANLILVPLDTDPQAIYISFVMAYLGLHALLIIAVKLRAPAKLRPRHEVTASQPNWFACLLALATVGVAVWQMLINVDALRTDFAASFGDAHFAFALEWLAVTGRYLAPLALVLVMIGALGQLGLASWVAWSVGIGSLLSFVTIVEEPFGELGDRVLPSTWSALALTVACVVGLVWARRADRRARTWCLLSLAIHPLIAETEAIAASLVGLCIVLFATPAGGRRPLWPWALVVVTVSANLMHLYTSLASLDSGFELQFEFTPHAIVLPELDHWRLWLTPPIGLLIASWYWARSSKLKDQRIAARLSWLLVAIVPLVLALTAWSEGAAQFTFAFSGGSSFDWTFSLPYLVLGWTPALLVLLAVHFGPREARATAIPAVPS